MMTRMSLDDRVYIVSGASRGMGREMAHALLQADGRVTITSPDRDELDATAAEFRRDFGNHRVLTAAFSNTDPQACASCVEQTIAHFGRIDGLVNNAGLGPLHVRPDTPVSTIPIWEADAGRWAEVVQVNVVGTFNMAQAAARPLMQQRWGRIVNISTSLATMIREGGTPYGATKAAIEAMTISWAQELKPYRVTVNCLLPGGTTDTAFVHDEVRRTRPMISPGVMRKPIVWLMSAQSEDFTGQRFVAKNWGEADPRIEAAKAVEPAVFRRS